MDINRLHEALPRWRARLEQIRTPQPADWTWYGYDILGNVDHLNALTGSASREALSALGRCPVADIGCADGDFGLLLDDLGHPVDLVDWPSTNWNGFRGAPELAARLDAGARIHQVELDSQFHLPRNDYGVVLFLGILYHLKNPYYALEQLTRHTEFCFISTRVARYTRSPKLEIAELPVAYLLTPDECNNDATNYWIFSVAGLRRLVTRCGWTIRDEHLIGADNSNPSDADADQRCFMLLQRNA